MGELEKCGSPQNILTFRYDEYIIILPDQARKMERLGFSRFTHFQGEWTHLCLGTEQFQYGNSRITSVDLVLSSATRHKYPIRLENGWNWKMWIALKKLYFQVLGFYKHTPWPSRKNGENAIFHTHPFHIRKQRESTQTRGKMIITENRAAHISRRSDKCISTPYTRSIKAEIDRCQWRKEQSSSRDSSLATTTLDSEQYRTSGLRKQMHNIERKIVGKLSTAPM